MMPPKIEPKATSETDAGLGLQERAAAALVAFAAGDALGWPQEMRANATTKGFVPGVQFRRWTRNGGGRFRPHEETIGPGEYSDDTQMTFAVGRARLTGSLWAECLARREIPLFHLYCRGAGRALLRACSSWRKGVAPWLNREESERRAYFEAGANGVAMRALPHVIWNAAGGSEAVLSSDIFLDGILTHGHPRALLGAALYAQAALFLSRTHRTLGYGELIRSMTVSEGWMQPSFVAREDWVKCYEATGGSIAADWARTIDEIRALLAIADSGLSKGALADDHAVLANLGCLGKFRGSGTVTAVAALYLASRYAAQPTGGVVSSAFAPAADTDTLGAMTAGLLGLLHGRSWMPSEWLRVQDASALDRLGKHLTDHRVAGSWKPFDDAAREHFLESLRVESYVSVDGKLTGKVVQTQPLEHRGVLTANLWKVALEDGQTIHVKQYVPKRPVEGNSRPGFAKEPKGSKQRLPRGPKAKVRGLLLRVGNMKQLTRFYAELLGVAPKVDPSGGTAVGPVVLVSGRSESVSRPHDQPSPALVVEAADIDAIGQRIVEGGGTQIARASDASELQWGRFADPEGNVIELVEPVRRRR